MKVRLSPAQVKEAADLARRLADLRDEVPWPFVDGVITEINDVVATLEGWALAPELEP